MTPRTRHAWCLAALALFWGSGCDDASPPSTPPPLPAAYPDLDPLVAARITPVRDAILADPDDARAWTGLGMIYQANWYPDLALECYEQAVALNATSARAWFYLAAVRAEGSRTAEAIDAMETAIDLAPDYAPARWRLGLLQLDAGAVVEAEQSFRQATELDPAEAASWCGLARVHLLRGEGEAAAKLIDRRLLDGPHAAYARHLLAAAHRQRGELDEARAALAGAATGSPPWQDLWTDDMHRLRTGLQIERQTALTLVRGGQYTEALTRLKKLQAYWPQDPEVLNNLGVALARTAQPQQAISTLQGLLALRPEHHVTLTNLALAHMIAGENLPLALEFANRALAANPHYAAAHGIKGRILFRSGDYNGAIESFRSAVDRDARRTELLVEIGRSQIALRQWSEAAASFGQAVERDPRLGQAHLGLGIARMEMGELQEASDALHEAVGLIGDHSAVYPVLQKQLDTLRKLRDESN